MSTIPYSFTELDEERLNVASLRTALLGCGYWGRNIARTLHNLDALAMIGDADPAVAELAEYYGVPFETDPERLLGAKGIDSVAIATPATAHFRHAALALSQGKHVFVEKPITLDMTEARSLASQAEVAGRTLMVGHLMRYHPAFLEMERQVVSGTIGGLVHVYSNRLNIGKLRREENVLWSFAPHDISMILALAKAAPVEVVARGTAHISASIADATLTHLRFAGGLDAHVFVSWLHPFKEQKLVAVGETGMLVFDDGQPWAGKLVLYRHRVGWVDGQPIAEKAEPEPVALSEAEPLVLELDHFLACARTGARPRTDAEEAITVLDVLCRATRSLGMPPKI